MWVEHRITEPLLRDFRGLLEAIQEELNSRWPVRSALAVTRTVCDGEE